MTIWERNFPPPLEITINSDCGISARTEIVAGICRKINELVECIFGLETLPIPVPGQGNCDERMPITFLRPCIQAVNNMIAHAQFDIEPIPQIGGNMDYHAFVPVCRNIAEKINEIIGEIHG